MAPLMGLHALPPELIIHILGYLPIPALLSFSQTCHSAHNLANNSMHTLSLGVYPTRFAKRIGEIYAADDACATGKRVSLLMPTITSDSSSNPHQQTVEPSTSQLQQQQQQQHHVHRPRRHKRRPERHRSDSYTGDTRAALAFHNKLTSSLLTRYTSALRHLELRLWTLSPGIATALTKLHALRTLALRIDNPFAKLHGNGSGSLRPVSGPAAEDERAAWGILATAVWPSLWELALAGGQPLPEQLRGVLRRHPGLRKAVFRACLKGEGDAAALLGWLCEAWEGRRKVRVLVLEDCGRLEVRDLSGVGELTNCQVLSFLGCRGLDRPAVEQMNKNVWHIPRVLLSHSPSDSDPITDELEVDSDTEYE